MCENCIKADVCKNADNVNEAVKNLTLTTAYQELDKAGIKLEVTCSRFIENVTYEMKGE